MCSGGHGLRLGGGDVAERVDKVRAGYVRSGSERLNHQSSRNYEACAHLRCFRSKSSSACFDGDQGMWLSTCLGIEASFATSMSTTDSHEQSLVNPLKLSQSHGYTAFRSQSPQRRSQRNCLVRHEGLSDMGGVIPCCGMWKLWVAAAFVPCIPSMTLRKARLLNQEMSFRVAGAQPGVATL